MHWKMIYYAKRLTGNILTYLVNVTVIVKRFVEENPFTFALSQSSKHYGNLELNFIFARCRNDRVQTEAADHSSADLFRLQTKLEDAEKMERFCLWRALILLQVCDLCLVGASGKTYLNIYAYWNDFKSNSETVLHVFLLFLLQITFGVGIIQHFSD